MAEERFTLESVRLFMVEKGGLCTNHDLVAQFKPFLNHPVRKLENRNKLKDFVQLLAAVETRNGEKVLVLKKRYQPQGCFNLVPNNEQSAQSTSEAPGGLVSIPEVFTSPEVPPEPLPPSRPVRSQRKDIPDATSERPISAAASSAPDMDFYSSMVGGKAGNDVKEKPRPVEVPLEETPPPPPAFTNAEPAYSSTNDKAQVESQESLPPAKPEFYVPERSSEEPDDVADGRLTPNKVETQNKTPMSAKERIRQFDQISDKSQQPAPAQSSRRGNKDNHRHTMHNSDTAEYDGSLTMVTLDSTEKQWLLMSATCDYIAMNKLVKERADLAHRRDFINGNAMHWAAKHGKPEVIKMLNGYQVDANLRSFCGYTPLHLAAMAGNEECIDLLVTLCKVQTNIRDFYGKRPKQYLGKNCSTRIQQMLLNNARQSFAVGSTSVEESNVFARTQSFSAKIMKSTQGLARRLTMRSSSDVPVDRTDSVGSPETRSKFSHRPDSRSMSQYTLSSDSGRESVSSANHNENASVYSDEYYAISRSESAPSFGPADDEMSAASGFTNIREF